MKADLFLKHITAAVVFILAVCSVSAQESIKSLEEEIRKAQEEIRINTELLDKTQKDQKTSQTQLKLIQSRISNRRGIINSLEKQAALLNSDIHTKNKTIYLLNADLEKLKQEYAEMVRAAYKNYKLNNFMLFLFAADDFNDITKRINFMRRYNRTRINKADEIKSLSYSISNEITELDRKKAELDETKESKNKELSNLGKDETQYKSTVSKLKAQESKINKELKAKQDQIDKAQRRIQELIAEEVRKSKKEERTAAQDKYITELSGRFQDNKGKLPYPVRGGVIIDKFGKHAHSSGRDFKIDNKGVKIAGGKNDAVNCVFEGTVSTISSQAGMNYIVLVNHGEYFSVYMNVTSLSVKAGDKVSTGQQIGRLPNSANDDDVFVHFGIWKQTSILNPEEWLRR